MRNPCEFPVTCLIAEIGNSARNLPKSKSAYYGIDRRKCRVGDDVVEQCCRLTDAFTVDWQYRSSVHAYTVDEQLALYVLNPHEIACDCRETFAVAFIVANGGCMDELHGRIAWP